MRAVSPVPKPLSSLVFVISSSWYDGEVSGEISSVKRNLNFDFENANDFEGLRTTTLNFKKTSEK